MSVEFEDYSIKVTEALNDGAIIGLYLAAAEIESEAVRTSPVGEGQLKEHWEHIVDESNFEATIGNPLENAIWNEYGTGAWAEGPKPGRSDPWYVPVEGYAGKKRPTYNGKVVIVYGKEGKKYYKTNGKKPQRTLEKAFTRKRKVAERLIKRAIQEAME